MEGITNRQIDKKCTDQWILSKERHKNMDRLTQKYEKTDRHKNMKRQTDTIIWTATGADKNMNRKTARQRI